MSPEVIISALVGAGGIGTLLFAALRFQREDASAVVTQAGKLIESMRVLLTQIESELRRCQEERERYRQELQRRNEES